MDSDVAVVPDEAQAQAQWSAATAILLLTMIMLTAGSAIVAAALLKKRVSTNCIPLPFVQPPDQTLRNLRMLRKLRKVALCLQGIFIFVSRSGSVWVSQGVSKFSPIFSWSKDTFWPVSGGWPFVHTKQDYNYCPGPRSLY